MVKTVLGVNHQGLREWFLQRITAIIMTVYTFGVLGFVLAHPNMEYYEWHWLFSYFWMRTATAIVFLALLYHAWIGMWTVFTDYIKIVWINITLQVLVILALIAFFLETLKILWSV